MDPQRRDIMKVVGVILFMGWSEWLGQMLLGYLLFT